MERCGGREEEESGRIGKGCEGKKREWKGNERFYFCRLSSCRISPIVAEIPRLIAFVASHLLISFSHYYVSRVMFC